MEFKMIMGTDGFGNIIEYSRGNLGEYVISIQGRKYALLDTSEQAEELAHKLIKIGRE